MIFDSIDHLAFYASMNPVFAAAAEFLKSRDWLTAEPGRYDIPGTGAWVSLQDVMAHPQEGTNVEFHRRYIDVQYVLKGNEIMGWTPLELLPADTPFDEERDLALIPGGRVTSWIHVQPGYFVIFFPTDVHAPCCGTGEIRKIVVKIPVAE